MERVNSQPAPTLEFLTVLTPDGLSLDFEESTIVSSCDTRLTFELGPVRIDSTGQENPGLLQDWLWGNPGSCGDFQPCGYIRVELLDAEGATLAQSESSQLYVTVSLPATEVAAVKSARATLIQGNTREAYTPEGAEIIANWEFTWTTNEVCDTGMGGAPALGGAPGLGGVLPALGGAGGAF